MMRRKAILLTAAVSKKKNKNNTRKLLKTVGHRPSVRALQQPQINTSHAMRYMSTESSTIYNEIDDSDAISTWKASLDSAMTEMKGEDSECSSADVSQNPQEQQTLSPSEITFAGDTTIPVTSKLHIVTPDEDTPRGIWPVFRLMDEDGTFRDPAFDGYSNTATLQARELSARKKGQNESLEKLNKRLQEYYPNHAAALARSGLLTPSDHPFLDTSSNHTLHRAYRQMVRLREMDTILQNAQRQGRISFYLTCYGEEAIHLGAASALELEDTVLAQYREAGLLMWRGFSLQQFTDQCFSNKSDLGKGRQMPIHYGSRALNYQTISSPLGTQIPQAAGAAYRLRMQGKDAVAACFFGEGCSSTPDFHSGLNFAATLGAPVLFICRNNGYAISTPVAEQYNGDGVVSRGPGYGVASIRVDGNDLFALHAATQEAREYAIANHAPVLIEAMTYRQGHHSTSDDSLQYRSAKEIEQFSDFSDPLLRFQAFLKKHDDFVDDDFTAIQDEEKMDVIEAMRTAEQKPGPSIDDMFEDVYHEMPPSLQKQQAELQAHLKKYPNQYSH